MSMFSNYDSTVNSLYLAFYGRPADPSGLQFWSKALADNNGNADTIIQAFAASQEAQTRFGSDTVSARITDIYEQLFNRAPDAAGLAFWTNAVEQGSATLAEVSLAILKGAQSSDLDLSTLRQKAADAFTAAVEDGSTEYSGYASIEAARVLVRAVTTDATDADLAKLVKAAVSFADTATKNPKVVDAIATGSTLLNLYDSARGLKDPVALTQALADTAKAAAGDPVTLESLLRGGGMDKVLKVMPAKATLTDVVEALAKGGLPAAVEVVYPTKPVVPAPTPSTPMELKFESVSQGVFDTNKKDNVTNVAVATVKFSYTGSDLKAGQGFQYSIDGVHWTSKGVSADPVTNVVTITGVNLTGASLAQPKSADFLLLESPQPVANVITTVQLQAVDANKSIIAKADGKIEYDANPPTGFIKYNGIIDGNSCTLTDPVATFEKIAILDHDLIQWHIEGDAAWTDVDQFNQDGTFTLPGLDMSKQGQKVEVRVIDAAGNIGQVTKATVGEPVAVTPKLYVAADSKGPVVNTNATGELQLVSGNRVYTVDTVAGNVPDTKMIVAQEEARSGTIQIKLQSGEIVKDLSSATFALGTGDGDSLSGTNVWGFGGNDTITGTDGDDWLSGGDGNDTINGGKGRDTVIGGAGGDTIDLGDDTVTDALYYERGDAGGPVFVNHGDTQSIDKIMHFGTADYIRLGKSFGDQAVTIRQTYLNASSGEYEIAIVRGTNSEDQFSAGATATDKDYMLQWMEDGVVSSIILKDYGTTAPSLTAAGRYIQNTPLPAAKVSDYVATMFNLVHSPSQMTILGSESPVNGVANSATFALSNYKSGFDPSAPGFEAPLRGASSINSSVLEFKSVLEASLYKMSWGDDTFTTATGTLKAGDSYFAGGVGLGLSHTGFELDHAPLMGLGNFNDSNDSRINSGFIVVDDGMRIHTGGGNDVVALRPGVNATLSYDALDDDAQDMILGFSAGSMIKLDGSLAGFDRADKGSIEWAVENQITATTEAVEVVLSQSHIVGQRGALSSLVGELNTKINVTDLALHDQLLILAHSADSSVLLVYQNLDGGSISLQEVTTVASFFGGAPTTDSIEVVGVEQGGIPG